MTELFFLRAILAALGLAVAAGPLGAFVVWRRMAFFGDATAHAAILGVAFGLALDLPVMFGTLLVALGMGALLARLIGHGQPGDTSIGVLAHAGLALGILALALSGQRSVNVESLLFGDILTVSWTETALIWAGGLAVLALIALRWSALLTSTLSDELAASAGIRSGREQGWIILALAIIVAIALRVVGALLISAMLIIPAATARNLSRTPEQMAIIGAGAAAIAGLGGLVLSYLADLPAGPSIVAVAVLLFIASMLVRHRD